MADAPTRMTAARLAELRTAPQVSGLPYYRMREGRELIAEIDALRADLASVTAARDAALADAGDLAAECKAWREAWEGRDHASDGDADPAHSHDRPGRWDDGRECASCCRFMRASAARGETDESGALYRHGGGA